MQTLDGAGEERSQKTLITSASSEKWRECATKCCISFAATDPYVKIFAAAEERGADNVDREVTMDHVKIFAGITDLLGVS